MPEYKCKSCNYSTRRKADYSKHIVTKKHLGKSNKRSEDGTRWNSKKSQKIECETCGKLFTTKKSLYRHQRNSCNKLDLKQTIEIEVLKKEIEMKNLIIEYEIQNKEYYKTMVRKVEKVINKSVNALTYIADNYDEYIASQAYDNMKCQDEFISNITLE